MDVAARRVEGRVVSSIEAWLARHGASPFTQAPARATDLVSNLALRAAADAFRAGRFLGVRNFGLLVDFLLM